MCTLLGFPFAAGMAMEHLDNTRKGYPTPLPLWHDWSTRYVIGLFAVLIDFLYFILPFFVVGVLFFCTAIGALVSGGEQLVLLFSTVVPAALITYEVIMFAIGVSAVGRLIYVDEGSPEKAMSGLSFREALRPHARRIYARARLLSLPAYLPALLCATCFALVVRYTPPFSGLLLLLLYWLTMSALLYAHLVVLQVYAGAEQVLTAFAPRR